MLPPPPPPGRTEGPTPVGPRPPRPNQRAGLAVLIVALAVLLGLVALVWWINEQDDDDFPSGTGVRPAAVAAAPA